ncbi:signal peptidase II [Algiphilus sp.]|uniref:signal peptidase II n=1 Tax=Algiphilus sp. TaxID=1872431 RepID=UPI0025C02103|nr:signal peptidase II [Algiphilus sp.]MCK5771914.1 signal peptidase II [Algiphilus sp.]
MRIRNAHWLWLSAGLILLDQISKQLIHRHLDWYEQIAVLPHFNIVHLRNTGVAFSMFAGNSQLPFILLALAVAVGILIWLRRNPSGQPLVAVSLCLILAGAIGNAIDRAARGYVIDFLDFYWGSWHFAAFNVADMAITIGAALMILDALLDWRRSRRGGSES